MRRLPVYLLLDTSGSMRGEPIAAVNVGLGALVASLRQDPSALESVHVSVMTFDAEVKVVVPLTPLDQLQLVLGLDLALHLVDAQTCAHRLGRGQPVAGSHHDANSGRSQGRQSLRGAALDGI